MTEWWILAPGLLAIVAVSGWLSLIDWREHRLPNRIVGPLAAGVAAWLVVLGLATSQFDRVLASLGWGFAGFAFEYRTESFFVAVPGSTRDLFQQIGERLRAAC